MNRKEENLTESQLLRIKAEEKLKANRKKTPEEIIEADAKKLLHELQVHQIELEMQNEELRQANATAEEALRRYTMLYDFAPMGYFILDGDGSITDLNFTGAEILGEKRFSLINSNFKVFLSEASKPVFNSFFKKIYASNAREACELMLSCNEKSLCRVYVEGVVTGDDRQCLLSVVDISGFKK
jgi:PAS domain-containing protein